MMLIIGLFIIIPIVLIIKKLNEINIKKHKKIVLNLGMLLISFLFIFLCFVVKKEPFVFRLYNPGDYITFSAVIFAFTPFLWIVTIYYIRKLFKNIRIKKNSIIKKDEHFIYYRDTLNEVSPGIVMFTSSFDIDYKKCISSVLLKLKLMGFIEKKEDTFMVTNKDDSSLLQSEKMVLNLVKTGTLDKLKYKQTVEKETIDNKYIRKNWKGVFGRITSIIVIILLTVFAFKFSFWFDKYVFKNYRYYIEKDDDKSYFILKKEKDVEKLYNEVTDENDYYGRPGIDFISGGEETYYSYNEIRANKIQYSVVRKAIALNFLVPLSIIFCIVWTVIAIYLVIEQLVFINKNYRRTAKGTELLNKAYALKNYLKDYSIINERKEEEIVLWEYYLVYATLLNVNEEIQDEVIQKYIK